MGDCQTKEQAGSMQDIRPLCVSQCVPHIDQPQFMNMGSLLPVFPNLGLRGCQVTERLEAEEEKPFPAFALKPEIC